ncbi:MAG: AsmA family protein [Thiogranum sp.]|jgi:uncharacterized protein involved in outer membrane biogenesis
MAILQVLKWILITFTVVLLAAVLYLSFADLNWMKPRIESAVADATGRRLQLGGDFDVNIVPAPSIVLEDVSLSNADWGSEPMLATIGHVSAELSFWSLLAGPVRVNEVKLRDVDVLLETNEQGESNWILGTAAEPAAAEPVDTGSDVGGGVPVLIEFAELRNIKLRYRAPDTEPFLVTLASFDVTTDTDGYTVLGGKGEIDKLPLTLTGKLGPDQALATGEDIGIDLNTTLGNLVLDVDGKIADLAQATGVDIKAVASSDDVAQILKHLAVERPLRGAMRVVARLTGVEPATRLSVDAKAGGIAATLSATKQDNKVSFEGAVPALDKVGKALDIPDLPAEDLTTRGRIVIDPQAYRLQGIVARLGDAEIKLDGSIEQGTDAATELSVKASGPSLAAFNAGLPTIPFKASVKASLTPEQLVLDAINATFGESDVAGALDVAMGNKGAISGKLSSKRLDLTPFAAGEAKGDKAGKSAPEAQQDKAESQYVFVEEPLPLEALNKTDVDIDADIGRLTLDKIVLLDVATALELKDGNLHFKNRFAEPGGGTSASDIVLTTAGGATELGVNVNMRDLHLNLLSGDIKDKSLVPPIGVTLDLKSKGGTPRALASSTDGRVLLTAGKGQIENNLLATVSGDVFAKLFSALNPFGKTDPFTTTDCTIVALNISDGMADIAGLYSQGDKVKVVGGGDIDLNTEALNIEFNTKPRKGVGVSADMFVTPFVKLKGTLANPSVGLDKKGALLAVGTGGLSVLAQAAVDRIAGEKDNCAKVLEEVGDHPPTKN